MCVQEGSEHEALLRVLIPQPFIHLVEGGNDDIGNGSSSPLVDGLKRGHCNAIVGNSIDVQLATTDTQDIGNYQVGINRFSRNPLGLVTRDDDVQWSNFVYWIISGIMYGEEQGITSVDSLQMPFVYHFGYDFAPMFRQAISVVGNYKEIYERNFHSHQRAAINKLNLQLRYPQHYPLPLE